jgi:cobalamin synthase
MSLRNAFAYLTALRVPPRARTPLTRSLHYFPWFGAAFGSVNVLAFLAVSEILPSPLACLAAALLPQILTGFSPARGVIESFRGRHTFPGHGFEPGFRMDARAWALAAAAPAIKWIALLAMHPDWRVRAAFVFPILGMSARTFVFLRDVRLHRAGGRAFAGRRVRAGFLSGALLFLAFLFPPLTGLALLAASALAAALTVRLRRDNGGDHPGRLTLQTASLTSEVAEVAALVVVAAFALAR